MAAGPKRGPGRFDVARSNGTPRKAISAPLAVAVRGTRKNVPTAENVCSYAIMEVELEAVTGAPFE
jgi:hypothetical protein